MAIYDGVDERRCMLTVALRARKRFEHKRNVLIPGLRSAVLLTMFLALFGIYEKTATATTIVAMADSELANASRAVIEGTVLASESQWHAADAVVYTYVTVAVEQLYKGEVPYGPIVLKQLGGQTEDNVTIVFGAPELMAGQRVLLFLNSDAEGSLHVAHLALGQYRIERDEVTSEDFVVRQLADVNLVASHRGTATDRAPHGDFVRALRDTLAAASLTTPVENASQPPALLASPPEFVPSSQNRPAMSNFTLLGSGYRWFQPDQGKAIKYLVNTQTLPQGSNGFDQAKAAGDAWSTVPETSLRIKVGRKPTPYRGLIRDGVNTISFGDPLGQIDDPVNGAGIVAIGSITAALTNSVTVGGKTLNQIAEADVVVNNGFESLLDGNPSIVAEILMHEIGHTLGIGHTSENPNEENSEIRDAAMYFKLHNDGRGASPRLHDVQAVQFLYPK